MIAIHATLFKTKHIPKYELNCVINWILFAFLRNINYIHKLKIHST